ncbi:MAG: hypothetical protein IH969_05530, partial [Candidatus Krumholzibacteriota bacterium]|nr:hypothetical protein [Candidatus Krumholzibacteriota bacterium]
MLPYDDASAVHRKVSGTPAGISITTMGE